MTDVLSRYGGKLPAHFRLSPSASSRWLHCHGSARTDLPESTNAAALQGRRLHELAAEILAGDKDYDADSLDFELIRPYLEFVRELKGELLFEQQFVSHTIYDLGGTLDCLEITAGSLHVVDLKTGKWEVPVEGNTQLKTYLLLAIERYPGRNHFRGTIVQDNEAKTADFTFDELMDHRRSIIRASVSQQLSAGEWCRFCTLKKVCPEYVPL